MKHKKLLLGLFFGIFLIICSYNISALAWVSPTNGTNHTSNIAFIISFINGTDMIRPTAGNSTFYFNTTAANGSNPLSWASVKFDNASYFSGWTIAGTGAATELLNITTTLIITDNLLVDTRWIWFNVTIGNVTQLNSTRSATIINMTIDDTPPFVQLANFTGNSTAGNNWSYNNLAGGLLNVTIKISNDSISNITSVLINITGPNGVQNSTYVTQGAATSVYWWNDSINATRLPQGKCNITIQATDLFGNVNNSAKSTITIDNTIPTVTFSCDSTTPTVGTTLTCTCTGSATSGIRTNSYGTYSPTIGNVGTYTESCTVTSFVGLSTSTSTTYTVGVSSSNSGSVGGGTGAATWTSTLALTTSQFEEGYTQELKAQERIKVTVAGGTHHVGVKSVTATSATIEISSNPVTVTLDIGEDAKVDVDNDGTYDLYVKLNSVTDSKADVTVKKLSETVPEGAGAVSTTGKIETTTPSGGETTTGGMSKTWIYVIIIVIILIAVGVAVAKKKK